MDDTEDLRLLRQMHTSGKLNDREYADAKVLLLNFGLSITEELQVFQQMHMAGQLTDKELATGQAMLLTLPKEKDAIYIVRSDRVDSAYGQRQLRSESILEQFDRGWKIERQKYMCAGAPNWPISVFCWGMIVFCLAASIVVYWCLYQMGDGTFSIWNLMNPAFFGAVVYLIVGVSKARSCRRVFTLYKNLRAELANRADIPAPALR